MSELRYIGPANDKTIIKRSDLRGKELEVVTQSEVTSAIDQELADKATGAELNSSVEGKLLEENLSGYGNMKIPRADEGKPGGPVRLVDGRVPNEYLPYKPGGRPWKNLGSVPSWRAAAFNSSQVIDTAGVLLVTTWSLPDIGYNYYPIFLGSVTLGDPKGAAVQIRQGSVTGPVFARAISGNTAYYDGYPLVPASGVQAIRSGTFYVVAGRKFSNAVGSMGGESAITCWAVPS